MIYGNNTQALTPETVCQCRDFVGRVVRTAQRMQFKDRVA
jgi:hypothetical protein